MPEHDDDTQNLALQDPPPARVEHSWEDEAELPLRPRRRLMTPLTGSLLAVLLLALGFIGGVLVQKGQGGSSTSAGGAFASRLAGLKGTGARSAGATTGAAASGGFGGFGAARANATTGTVTFIQGKTLYVETTEGGTVKVQTSTASSVTKTVKGTVHSIKPGETVVVTGSKGSSGAVQAESIRVGSTGAAGLFGGTGATGAAGASSSAKSGSGSTGEPQLFGPGG
jgi:hypothetical protein